MFKNNSKEYNHALANTPFESPATRNTSQLTTIQKWPYVKQKGSRYKVMWAYATYPLVRYYFTAVQYFREEMDLPHQKQQLPQTLIKIYLKRSALLLQRLVLYESQPQKEARVRHYDIECQAIEMFIGFFKKKYQSVLMKNFNAIRAVSVLPQKREEVMPQRKKRNVTTRRTNLTATPVSDLNFKRTGGVKQTRLRRPENDENMMLQSRDNQHCTLRGIISKIKSANAANSLFLCSRMQTDHGPNLQNTSFFLVNSPRQNNYRRFTTPYDIDEQQKMLRFRNSPIQNRRHSRREFILNKIHHIEDSLSQLCNEEDTKQEEANFEILNSINTLRRELQAKRH